jgi:23S rRNA (uracil1939-C5)-methyltransferase
MSLAVTIDGIAAGGDGVGRLPDGMAVFVPRTAPGDEAEIKIVERKRRFARGRLVRLAVASPVRIDPRCRHYQEDGCGGCQLQHMALEAQVEAKRRLVGDALRRIGKLKTADPPMTPSSVQWRYRSRVKLTAAHGRIGLRTFDRPDRVFCLVDCLIASEPIMALWAAMKRHRTLLPTPLESLMLREDRNGHRHCVVTGGDTPWDARALALALGDRSLSVWWRPTRGAPRVLEGPVTGFPAAAFEQVSRETAARLRAAVVAAAGEIEHKVVWDLYAGVGETADLMAERGASVWSVERDQSAVEWGRNHGSQAVTRMAGLVEETLARLPEPDVVVLNPPRAGVASSVSRWLEAWAAKKPGPRRIVYVSCDPATLARDLARMPRFSVGCLEAYDLFPQTAHVETIVMAEAN